MIVEQELSLPSWMGCAVIAGVAAVIVLGLLIWGVRNPVVWRLLSVLAVGSGVSLLVWGITSAAMGEELAVVTPTSLIGAGAGVTVGGIMLFVISLCGRR
jgi:hypothetical protein